jgi:hypothetical protein
MININQKIYKGNSIVISNGKVIIDGKDYTPSDEKEVNIAVVGNLENIEVDMCNIFSISGNCGSVQTTSGDVTIKGEVEGNVQTLSGDINCGIVKGNITTMSGNITGR